ncbi:MAG: hypothetical protein JSW66_08775 [Phycisphaerales bacterium]|nr:MAG: hypothetical protein JSW66_08775 [Phycisphaerales bacterium]
MARAICDPAGQQREGLSGLSFVRELRAMGIRVRYRASGITEGTELIRAAILGADGKRRVFVSPRCPRLIEALECYHHPEKEGVYDHPIDALRYFFVNTVRFEYVGSRRY